VGKSENNKQENEETDLTEDQPDGLNFFHGGFVRVEFYQKKSIKRAMEMSGEDNEVKKIEKEEESSSDSEKEVSESLKQEIIENSNSIEQIRKEIGTTKGLKKWINEYHSVRPAASELQQEADAFMHTFTTKEAERIKEKHETHNQPDNDGFIKVQRGSSRRNTHTDGKITVTAAKGEIKTKKDNILLDFYRFQRRKARETQISELRKRFEEDKHRIAKLKAARRFKPY